MIQSRLKTVIRYNLLVYALVCLGLYGLFPPGILLGEGITPGRNISMVKGEPLSPKWKILWDQARKFSREENYYLAVQAYRQLLTLKSNIEEANWEYCKVLLKVEDYSLAGTLIGSLLEKDPSNNDYLLAAGAIAVDQKNFDDAVHYYGKVFEKAPAGTTSDTALLGLANGLRSLGKIQLSFPLFEQYYLRHPVGQQVLYTLATDALKLGRMEKARELYGKLLENPEVDGLIIFQAAQAFDQPGFEKKRNSLWLSYLRLHPDYLPFRKKLKDYYLSHKEYEKALKHLEYLVENVADNGQFLLQAAGVSWHELKRPDKALQFFERYKLKYPQSKIVKNKINGVQNELARNFLIIVENDRASQLWQDLEKITVNRHQLYLKMADLLEKRGQREELIEVLEILYSQGSGSDSLAMRLAGQYRESGMYDQSLIYLKKIKGRKSKTKDFLLLRGDTELNLGLEMEALVTFERALARAPGDIKLRGRCLKLAGSIGNTAKMKYFFQGGVEQKKNDISLDFINSYLDLLQYNYLFHEYEKTYNLAKKTFASEPEIVGNLDIGWAKVLRKQGNNRMAEQKLRLLLTQNENQKKIREEILFLLTEHSLRDENLDAAENWYDALEKEIGSAHDQQSGLSEFPLTVSGLRLLLLKVKMLKVDGKYNTALGLIDDYLLAAKSLENTNQFEPSRQYIYSLKSIKCWLLYQNRDFEVSYIQHIKLLKEGQFDPNLWLLAEKLKMQLPSAKQNQLSDYNRLSVSNTPVLSNLISVAAAEIESSEFSAAQVHIEQVLNKYPESVIARNLWIETMRGQGKGGRALETLSDLLGQFPKEKSYADQQIDIETRRGGYKKGLTLLARQVGVETTEQMIATLNTANDPASQLRLARLLWGDKQQKKALDIYSQLLQNSVLEQLSKEFQQKKIDPPYYTNDKTIWNSMLLMLQSEPKVLEELMAPPFLLDNLDNETGEIIAGYFGKYSWQKLISNEYKARKAIYDRNYYYAEQSYKQLMEQAPQEGMLDLATVYGKIGKYRKEAQLYKAIQESGASSPELSESIERNNLQLGPKSSFNAGYYDQKGRNGHIDMAKLSLGTDFEFTPDLDMEVRLLYENNQFESLVTDDATKNDVVYGQVTYEVSKGYDLIFGGGVEKLSGDSDSGYRYKLGLTGQLDDYIDGYLLLEKKQVYDTIGAIEEQITYQVIEAGLNVETPIGLAFGGDFQHRYYNDSNAQNRFHGYSSYTIFKDSIRLGMRYDYQYLTSEDNNGPESLSLEGSSSSDDLLYWSPSSFSEHRAGVSFQQEFLGFEQGEKKNMSYWAIDSGIGLEENENLIFISKIDIFLEMSPHFLLKGNFTLSKSDDYEEKGISLSLNYRW